MPAVMPGDHERALNERVAEQIRLEQSRDVRALCELILPEYRTTAAELSYSTHSFEQLGARVHSAELISFEVERYEPAAQRFGGRPAAVVRTTVCYNSAPKLAAFRTIWVFYENQWYTTAVGKRWLG